MRCLLRHKNSSKSESSNKFLSVFFRIKLGPKKKQTWKPLRFLFFLQPFIFYLHGVIHPHHHHAIHCRCVKTLTFTSACAILLLFWNQPNKSKGETNCICEYKRKEKFVQTHQSPKQCPSTRSNSLMSWMKAKTVQSYLFFIGNFLFVLFDK